MSEAQLIRKVRQLRQHAHVLARAGRSTHAFELRLQANGAEQLFLARRSDDGARTAGSSDERELRRISS